MRISKVLTLSLFLFLFCIDLNLVSCQRYYSITPNTYFWRSNPVFTLDSVRSPVICFNKIKSISDSANILVVENFIEQNRSYQSFRCNAYTFNPNTLRKQFSLILTFFGINNSNKKNLQCNTCYFQLDTS